MEVLAPFIDINIEGFTEQNKKYEMDYRTLFDEILSKCKEEFLTMLQFK